MSARLKNIFGAFAISGAMWVGIISGGVWLYGQMNTGLDVTTTASVR